ncbi:transcriptional regulator [Burkholderia vietnamiensis]|uniref:Transcriptional regulator n=1 Tax=Burkholderia ubonensis TaxID=101571 RepID=A0A1B4LA38_9BURK|nr:transposase family protein [Burkholderia vietnamiensis LMG 10929]AOJ74036.1 transcriptional regulator [Burkholderia ubonensis]AOK10391.1 transcriptional regulator [Burkholderia vietnamiensis]KVF15280.1 transcriptional regulator [Burkholderia vietnamiensis]KVM59541.1 transcriptional regulator [Burkholderia vietnamiensis]
MAKYDERFRLQVVREYLEGEASTRTLAARYGVGRTVIRRWVASYREHGVAGLRRKVGQYDARFKLSVLQRMQRDGLSYGQTAAVFDIRSVGHVSTWERLYHEGGFDALSPRRRGRPRKMATSLPPKPTEAGSPDERSREELLKENEYLRAEVAYLKKLDALLQAKKQAAQKKKRK